MKKILFITNKAPHYRIPLFNELAKKLNIKFIFTHENKKIPGLKADYELIKGIGYKKYKIHPGLIKIIKEYKPSKVVLLPPDPLHLIDNVILSRFLMKNKIPYVLYAGAWEYKEKLLRHKINERLILKILKNAEKCLAYGTRTERWLLKLGVKKNKIIKVYNINPNIYLNLKKSKRKLKKFKNKLVILYVGRIIKRKGINYLINAFSQIKEKNTVLVIVGGGDFYNLGEKSLEKSLKKKVKIFEKEKRVFFEGEKKPEEIQKYYLSSDIFVIPSITKKIGEPWGHVVEEALSFGLPIITTDAVGATEDLIKDGGNGFIVPEKNSEKLKEAIEKLIKNKKMREIMGKESLRIIKQKKFSFEEILKEWVKVLEK